MLQQIRYLLLGTILVFAGNIQAAPDHMISVMQYNVENLFDTRHDKGKSDHTFLPLKKKQTPEHQRYCQSIQVLSWKKQCLEWDWSQKALNLKMRRLADVLAQVNEGRGPDLVVLQEVENKRVLERFNRKYLKAMNYKTRVLLEGPDERGIDIALLSRLPLAGAPQLHLIPFGELPQERRKDTRGILEVPLLLPDGRKLTVFGVHLPAPYHPTSMRKRSLEHLNRLKSSLPSDALVLVAGDFNITSKEDQASELTPDWFTPDWILAHLQCVTCKGTSYYEKDKTWSFLDRILLSRTFETGPWRLMPGSVSVITSAPEQVDEKGLPKRFRLPQGSGVSDHLPLVLNLTTHLPAPQAEQPPSTDL